LKVLGYFGIDGGILIFPGDWQRAVVVASTIPFVASLAWRSGRNARAEAHD
jgi:hypothetical protein